MNDGLSKGFWYPIFGDYTSNYLHCV